MTALTADFTKVENQSKKSDTVRGKLYQFNGRLVIAVHFPIEQFMFIDSLETLIYNPSEHAGIRISRKTRSFLPFFHTFIGFFKGDQIVPQVNFRIKSSARKNDSLYTEWEPVGSQTSFRGKFETVYYNDRPVRAATYDKKGALVYQMTFGHDTLVNGTHVPLRISTLTPAASGPTLEEVEFRNAAVNNPVPAEIAHFKIPPDVPVKVIEW